MSAYVMWLVTALGEGSLLGCCECPASYHTDCIKSSPSTANTWQCPSCSVGRKPLYGEIVWAKFGRYRWATCSFYRAMLSQSAVMRQ